jgi:hypothetical protein
VDTQALQQKHARVKVFMKDSKGDELRVKPLEIPAIVTGMTVDAATCWGSSATRCSSSSCLADHACRPAGLPDKSIKEIIKESRRHGPWRATILSSS